MKQAGNFTYVVSHAILAPNEKDMQFMNFYGKKRTI
jgi:hypothetical protein